MIYLLLTPWPYGPLRALASFQMHKVKPHLVYSWLLFNISSFLVALVLSSWLTNQYFVTSLPYSSLKTCPRCCNVIQLIHYNLLMSAAVSKSLFSIVSLLVLILDSTAFHFLTQASRCALVSFPRVQPISVKRHISLSYISIDLTIVLCIVVLTVLLSALDFKICFKL